MRNSFYLMPILFISCEGEIEKIDSDYFSGLEFTIDTVLIDTGEEILFLKYGLISSGIDVDRKDFYENINDEMGFVRLYFKQV